MAYLGLGSTQLGLELLQKFALFLKNFPDAPADFVPPRLFNPDYVPITRPGKKAVEAACLVLVIVPVLVVVSRLLTRMLLKSQALGLDDAAISLALFAGLGFWTTNLLLFQKGKVGYHTYDLAYSELQTAIKLQVANILFYICTISFVRFSVLFFTMRLSSNISVRLRSIVRLTLAFQTAWMITMISLALFSCKPIAAMWDFDVRLAGGECLTLYPAMLATAVIWVVLDVWVVSLPIPIVLRLQMPVLTRCGVTFLFALGYLTSCASLVRVFFIRPVYNSWDPAWNATYLLLWDEIEIGLGLIAASLPALNALFIRILSRWSGSPSLRRRTMSSKPEFVKQELVKQEHVKQDRSCSLVPLETDEDRIEKWSR